MSDDHGASTTRELIDVVRAFAGSDLRELSVSSGGIELFISRADGDGSSPVPVRSPAPTVASVTPTGTDEATAPEPKTSPGGDDVAVPSASSSAGATEVRSPAVGIFYRRPSPDKDPYVEVGSRVAVGDPVGTIEVMKMFTSVPTPVAGVVTDVCVDDGAFVEHGQVIVYIDESA